MNERARLRSSLLNGESTETVVATMQTAKGTGTTTGKSHELASFFNCAGGILQRTDRTVGKGISPSDCCLATRRTENKRVAHSSKETYAELEQLLSKDKSWILAEKQALGTLKEKETTLQAILAERRQKREEHQQAPLKPDTTGKQGVAD